MVDFSDSLMNNPIISIIAAIGENRELGKNNKLLWHIPEDFKRFKEITSNHPVIMGRKTYESIGKPLPNRVNIIVTRDKNFHAENCFAVYSLEAAIDLAKTKDEKEIFIIGGGQIYNQAINIADKLYLTIVKEKFGADTFFPDYSGFKEVVFHKEGRYNNYRYDFYELVK